MILSKLETQRGHAEFVLNQFSHSTISLTMMYIIAVFLNSLVIFAFLAQIMHRLKYLILVMMRKNIDPVHISILTATITMISAFLFNRIAIVIMKTHSMSPFKES